MIHIVGGEITGLLATIELSSLARRLELDLAIRVYEARALLPRLLG